MPTKTILALAETIAPQLEVMTDDELRVAARRMVAPFMCELALRGCSFMLRSEDFLTLDSMRRRH